MILQCRPKVPLVNPARFNGQQYLKKIEGLPLVVYYLIRPRDNSQYTQYPSASRFPDPK